MGWSVYAIYNRGNKKIYIGQTGNLERRVAEHNRKRGNHFTSKVLGKWELLYNEECGSRTDAIRRERQLKSFKGREFIKKLINNIPL